MGAGALTAETETEIPLREEVETALSECIRAKAAGILRADATPEDVGAFAGHFARHLHALIGGSYIPLTGYGETLAARRARRDAAIWAEFDGGNHAALMRKHEISRRLLYSILARRPKG